MSQTFGKQIAQDSTTPRKCRIPQRVGSGKHRPLSKSRDKQQATRYPDNGKKVEIENAKNGSLIASPSTNQGITVPERKISSGKSRVNAEEKGFSAVLANEFDATKFQTANPIELKKALKEKWGEFEKMRNDLNERQGTVMEVYAALKTTEEQLALLGHKTSSSNIDNDLQIMNVAKLTPRQLLQLCGETKSCSGDIASEKGQDIPYCNIDMETFYDMPSKVFETCEAALRKYKELVNWLENFKPNEKDLLHGQSREKINEFNIEYDMLNNKVQAVKTQFGKDLTEITDIVRKCVKETIAVKLRNEDLTNKLSQLNSKNSLLQKQINDKDQVFKLHPSKMKIEELEKKLKEEKLKNVTARERLKKFESEAKMYENNVIRLEGALNQARAENVVLERTIQNQVEQNQQLQKEFNDELCKLTDSIKENSDKLGKIEETKSNIQNEKEELEMQLKTLTEKYNKSINNLKMKISGNTRRVVEMEKKYKEELDEINKLQVIIQTQKTHLEQKDERYKETLKQLHETEAKLSEALKQQEKTKEDFNGPIKEIGNLNMKIMEQNKLIEDLQERLDAAKTLEDKLRNEIKHKTQHIEDQQKVHLSLEDKTKENELKMQVYEKQLMTLREHIKNIKENYGEYENLSKLNSMISEQNHKILELNQRNEDLKIIINNQAEDLKACMHTISAQEEHIQEKDALIKGLSEKEKKLSNMIFLLQKGLASKANKTDNLVNGKLIEKDSEIKSLIVDIGSKEKRISQMEKVMIALYVQARKTKSRNKKYQEKINILKQVISEYETYISHMNDSPSEHLDRLLRIIENEVETTVYLPSSTNDFVTNFLNKKRRIIKSKQIPCILVQDHSSSRGLLLDSHSREDLQATRLD